eukprot:tig00021589_g22737.t1
MFMDMCVNASGEAELRLRDTVALLVKLGYDGCALNTTVTGKIGPQHICNLAPVLLTRITVVVDQPADVYQLNPGNQAVRSYDLVAVRPTSEKAFQLACASADVDIISLDMSARLPFTLRHQIVSQAIDRGVFFEITTAPALKDATARRYVISNAIALFRATRGKNLVLSSGATLPIDIRGPYDLINLGTVMGMNHEKSKNAISTSCRSAVIHAETRKVHRSMVRVVESSAATVEEAPSSRKRQRT